MLRDNGGYIFALSQIIGHSIPIENIEAMLTTKCAWSGVKFNKEIAKNYPGKISEPQHFILEDGSCTNY